MNFLSPYVKLGNISVFTWYSLWADEDSLHIPALLYFAIIRTVPIIKPVSVLKRSPDFLDFVEWQQMHIQLKWAQDEQTPWRSIQYFQRFMQDIQDDFVLLMFGQYDLFSGGLRIFKDPFWLWIWGSDSFVKKEREDIQLKASKDSVAYSYILLTWLLTLLASPWFLEYLFPAELHNERSLNSHTLHMPSHTASFFC